MRLVMAVAVLGLAPAVVARAQSEAEPVLKTVRNVFDGMRTRDTALMRAQFAPNARLVGVDTKNGKTEQQVLDVSMWIGGVGRGTGPAWDERIFDPTVEQDGNIAHVWTYYEFWRGSTLSHCGYDSFFLVKLSDGWKVSQVADTRRTDCKPRS